MNFKAIIALIATLVTGLAINIAAAQNVGGAAKSPAFTFADTQYFHRYTINDPHEYTPAGQEDLKTWTDMLTIHYYRKVKDGEARSEERRVGKECRSGRPPYPYEIRPRDWSSDVCSSDLLPARKI